MTITRRSAAAMLVAAPTLLAAASPRRAGKSAAPAASSTLTDRIAAGLWAMAIGDGMGAPVEGWEGERVRAEFGDHDFTTFLPPTDPAVIASGLGKGHGRITDDMILIEALIAGYAAHRDHLGPHDYARLVIAPLGTRKIWVPERQAEMTALQRPVWWPERYAYHALVINNADPRTAGQGNWPQQGLMGMVLPTGAVNAGDPVGAYGEVIGYGVAHQHSFGLEAAAVTAACFAAAFAGQDIAAIIAAGRALARDGTAAAIDAVLASVNPADDYPAFEAKARAAYRPFANPAAAPLPGGSAAGAASRLAAAENLTAGLAALVHGQGDFLRTIKAALFYGQDNESIAALALGLLAGSRGTAVIPPPLLRASAAANRRDYDADAAVLADVAGAILARDTDRLAARRAALAR